MKKLMVLFLIFIILFSILPSFRCFFPFSVEVEAEKNIPGNYTNGEFYEESYLNYLIDNGYDSKMATSEVKVDLTQFTKSDEMMVSIDNDSINTGDRGIIIWQFEIKEAGFYNIEVMYFPIKGTNSGIERKMYIDNKILFKGMEQIVFNRIWDNGQILNKNGNEILPTATESSEWQRVYIRDSQRRSLKPYAFYFSEGKHTLSFESLKEPLKIVEITLKAAPELQPYNEVIKQLKQKYPLYSGKNIIYQAERIDDRTLGIKKSSPSIVVGSDYSSPNTVPYHPYKIKLNTIGGNSWRTVGDFITWEIEVPEEGLYRLSFRGRQNVNRGIKSYRELRINGEVPFKEASKIGFEFSGTFQNYVCGDENGPYLFYFKKGKNTISLEVVLGDFSQEMAEVEQSLRVLNEIYRKTIQITGLVPDKFIDYEIEKKIPDFREKLKIESERLYKVVDNLVEITKEKGDKTVMIEKMAAQAAELSENAENVVLELSSFKQNISGLGTWMLYISEMPLEIDSLTLSAENAELPEPEPNFFVKAYYEIVRFISTFFVDYTNLQTEEDIGKDAVKVWISSGRDQAQIIRSLIDDSYSPISGIPVNLQLIPLDVIIPATLAGTGPDVVLNVSQSTVMNFAVRNALTDLTEFDDFESVKQKFYPSALKTVTFDNKIFGIPEQQAFMMMFYRKDILDELGLKPPKTWEEVKRIIPILHMNNYDFWLPNSIFSSLVFQYGGDIYKGDGENYGIASGLIEENAMLAFEELTEFFTAYKLPVTVDFSNRFRTGEIPIGIASYTTYNQLEIFAPEIKGLWSFAPVPGIVDSNGNINNTIVSDTSHCILMESAKNKKDAWDFIKWWISDDIQLRYAYALEAIMGTAARYPTANRNVLVQLAWPREFMDQLLQQFESSEGVPEVPGGYMTFRMVDYAFKSVVTDGQNPREALYLNIKEIDKELTKKRKEFHLSYIE
ncbi:MAG: extracellular solute-binding protein [Firmicutes bacterium]|nr:extracellular solute-binding protein [Bacillota bacterium]